MATTTTTVPKKVDILIWGVTGFTGVLVGEYAAQRYGNSSEKLTFGLGGRNRQKVEEARDKIAKVYPAAKDWPVFTGDSNKQDEMDQVVSNARVVATTVGPYMKYGLCLVDACVRYNVDYVDITGEVSFLKAIIAKYHDAAKAKNLLIVPCCGFDCIPADTLVMLVEVTARETLQREVDYVYTAVGKINGGIGGGTLASAQNEMKHGDIETLTNYWILAPEHKKRPVTEHDGEWKLFPRFVGALKIWTVPFLLSVGSIRLIYRSINLRGKDYAYSEGLRVNNPIVGAIMWAVATIFPVLASLPIVRNLLFKVLPQPGQGPDRKSIENGSFSLQAVAVCKPRSPAEKPRKVYAHIEGKRDPGFGATCRMLLESAVTIALHKKDLINELPDGISGGILTPSVALGRRLVERLQANADIQYQIIVD